MKYNPLLDWVYRSASVPQENKTIGQRLHGGEWTSPLPEEYWNGFLSSLTQTDILFYPDDSPAKELLASKHGVSSKNILMFAGSDMALRCIFEAFLTSSANVLMPEYHFPMYDVYASIMGAGTHFMRYSNLTMLPPVACPDINLIVVGNPNSPVGDSVSLEFYETVLEPYNVPIVVDSAYADFGCTDIPIDKINSKYIFVHSLSKSAAAAGLRCGYAIACDEIIGLLNKVRPMMSVTGITIKYVEWALDHHDILDEYVKNVIDSREKVCERFYYNIGGNWVHLPMHYADEFTKAGFTFKSDVYLPCEEDPLLRISATQDILNYI